MLFSLADAKGQGTKQFQTSDPRTEEAVIARDEQWLAAEISGNTTYLDGLLLPEYRSIGPDGRIHDKIAVLASARNNKGSSEKAASIAKWTANHPYIRSASLIGDIAIVTFTLNKIAAPKSVLSCDIFLYRDGRWRGLYSHSTDAAK
jgi:hypothetical protein